MFVEDFWCTCLKAIYHMKHAWEICWNRCLCAIAGIWKHLLEKVYHRGITNYDLDLFSCKHIYIFTLNKYIIHLYIYINLLFWLIPKLHVDLGLNTELYKKRYGVPKVTLMEFFFHHFILKRLYKSKHVTGNKEDVSKEAESFHATRC